MSTSEQNPLFTRSEKGRFGRTMKKRVRGAARKGFSKIFGIPLSKGLGGASPKSSRRPAHRSQRPASGSGPSTSVRSDVISALKQQGYNAATVKKMAEGVRADDTFESAFRRVISRNPAELIIFGNPEKVYSLKNVSKVKRTGNPVPAALLTAFESAAGSKLFDAVTSKPRKKNLKKRGGKKNPEGASTERAEQLFETFHHRAPEGVFELQRSAKARKDYTILGPLVALGINGEKFDKIKPRPDDVVEHWEKLPHACFLPQQQVDQVKRILGDPQQYITKVPLLASSPNGKQLYVICEEPLDIDLSQFETDTRKDFVDLGETTFVVYIAKKPNTPAEWVHTFGEEGGARPRLVFDKLTRQILFIGGSYRVEGAGIIN